MKDYFKDCTLCPRLCHIDRTKNPGICGAKNKMIIARASLHMWEEPCISGDDGSGTIFFSGCNLKCVFCQNYEISTKLIGKEVSVEEFSNICINLEKKGANNINLVTPTHFVPLIVDGIKLARSKGLTIPIVYNTSGYENVETLKLLEGIIDIYLPDFKYFDNKYGLLYSHIDNYSNVAKEAIKEMFRQVGKPVFDKNGMMLKGVIVRHLALPELSEDSKKILKYLYDTYKDNIYISIMNQYTPLRTFKKFTNLNRKLTDTEYDDLINYAVDLGIEKAFIQEGETQSESFIPNFLNQDLPL